MPVYFNGGRTDVGEVLELERAVLLSRTFPRLFVDGALLDATWLLDVAAAGEGVDFEADCIWSLVFRRSRGALESQSHAQPRLWHMRISVNSDENVVTFKVRHNEKWFLKLVACSLQIHSDTLTHNCQFQTKVFSRAHCFA